ncbi:Oligopeptide transporter 7 [Fagus crenata]
MLTSLSWICWISPKSVVAQQLGSGLSGLGVAAFGLDWATISAYLQSPLASPWFATANIVVFSCHGGVFYLRMALPFSSLFQLESSLLLQISMLQAITFLQDFKLGHYMKIPPRTMFMAQIVGTLLAGLVYLSTAWWLMETVPNICLDKKSVWTCPGDTVFYDACVIWGLIGPQRIFGNLGTYTAINWFFLGGAIAPILVWLATKAFPQQEWIRLINMYKLNWWRRHNYVLSGALDAGLAFMAVLMYFCLNLEEVNLEWWGNELDGCPLASCPSAKGVVVDGCPVFY